ncbi:hypothetical protein [Brumimicrobium sp.]|uniref:hypothetical protein n=1 Tax=Brumimicrobium sp. TaxID=2029867 RepID=UPI002632C94F|nr:hypothetical protein [uncultured Brumimicrobium sp.]
MNTYQKLILVGTGLLLITSCSNNEENTKAPELKKTAIIEVDTTDVYTSDDYDFVLPRPFALVSSFENAGLDFVASRMNDPKNIEKYTTDGKQLLNFGVYSSDLVYSIISDQTQASITNFNAIKNLADKIGMGSIFNEEDLAKQIEDNISDREEMESLMIDVYERSQEFLENNDMRILAAVQFSGAWFEGMYLATFDVDKKDKKKLSHTIVDHMNLLKQAIKGLESYKERGEDTAEVLAQMKELQSTYKAFDSIKNAKGFPELSPEEIKIVTAKIHEIRELIIS